MVEFNKLCFDVIFDNLREAFYDKERISIKFHNKGGTYMSAIPNDPVILLSFLNTKLRDHYDSLSALCDDLEQDEAVLTQKIAAIGYSYDSDRNQFI